MCSKSEYDTRYTLIDRALDLDDQQAWQELVEYYKRFITYIIPAFNIPTAHQDDLKQLILINLAKDISTYDRDKGKFRTWFGTIIKRRCLNYQRSLNSGKAKANAPLESPESLDFFPAESELDEIIDKEWENYIMDLARERLLSSHGEAVVAVFDLALKGYSTADIAAETGFAVNTVYSYQARAKLEYTKVISVILAELGDQ